ncbi:hypothetical protein GCM10011313_03810 [Mycetocola zhadangensis]|nr:hypothetical protein GCM10011313_03810 [Mycetocola zhadangensis]
MLGHIHPDKFLGDRGDRDDSKGKRTDASGQDPEDGQHGSDGYPSHQLPQQQRRCWRFVKPRRGHRTTLAGPEIAREGYPQPGRGRTGSRQFVALKHLGDQCRDRAAL